MNNEKKDLEIKKKPQEINDTDLDKVNGGVNPCNGTTTMTECSYSTLPKGPKKM